MDKDFYLNKPKSDIIFDKLGLGPASFVHKQKMRRYIELYKAKKNRVLEKYYGHLFPNWLSMGLYVLDGIENPERISIIPSPVFQVNDRAYQVETHCTTSLEEIKRIDEGTNYNGSHIRNLIHLFNKDKNSNLYIYDLFSRIREMDEGPNYSNIRKVIFESKFYIQEKSEDIIKLSKLL